MIVPVADPENPLVGGGGAIICSRKPHILQFLIYIANFRGGVCGKPPGPPLDLPPSSMMGTDLKLTAHQHNVYTSQLNHKTHIILLHNFFFKKVHDLLITVKIQIYRHYDIFYFFKIMHSLVMLVSAWVYRDSGWGVGVGQGGDFPNVTWIKT